MRDPNTSINIAPLTNAETLGSFCISLAVEILTTGSLEERTTKITF